MKKWNRFGNELGEILSKRVKSDLLEVFEVCLSPWNGRSIVVIGEEEEGTISEFDLLPSFTPLVTLQMLR
jgi:hypothetical protein